jgi:hypothetical protein
MNFIKGFLIQKTLLFAVKYKIGRIHHNHQNRMFGEKLLTPETQERHMQCPATDKSLDIDQMRVILKFRGVLLSVSIIVETREFLEDMQDILQNV